MKQSPQQRSAGASVRRDASFRESGTNATNAFCLQPDMALPISVVEARMRACLPRGATIEPRAVAAVAALAAEFISFVGSEAHAVAAIRRNGIAGVPSVDRSTPLEHAIVALRIPDVETAIRAGIVPQYGAVQQLTVDAVDVSWATTLLGFSSIAAGLPPCGESASDEGVTCILPHLTNFVEHVETSVPTNAP